MIPFLLRSRHADFSRLVLNITSHHITFIRMNVCSETRAARRLGCCWRWCLPSTHHRHAQLPLSLLPGNRLSGLGRCSGNNPHLISCRFPCNVNVSTNLPPSNSLRPPPIATRMTSSTWPPSDTYRRSFSTCESPTRSFLGGTALARCGKEKGCGTELLVEAAAAISVSNRSLPARLCNIPNTSDAKSKSGFVHSPLPTLFTPTVGMSSTLFTAIHASDVSLITGHPPVRCSIDSSETNPNPGLVHMG